MNYHSNKYTIFSIFLHTLLFLSLSIFSNSCKILEPEPNSLDSTMQVIPVNDIYTLEMNTDPVTIDSAKTGNLTLVLFVSYSGGCATHEFQLYAENSFAESAVPQAYLYLGHNANGDNCEAWIQETLTFDLQPLTEIYRDQYRGNGPMYLRISAPDATEPVQPLLYFEF
jgi:hypothetical protein